MIKKALKNKRGISPLIATVLLVALTITLASLIFFWLRGFIPEQIEKFGQAADESCKLISFSADLSRPTSTDFYLDVTNTGNIPINEFDIKKYGVGKSNVDRISAGLAMGESKTIQLSELTDDVSSITVIPVLLGTVKGTSNRKSFKCTEDLGKNIDVPEVQG